MNYIERLQTLNAEASELGDALAAYLAERPADDATGLLLGVLVRNSVTQTGCLVDLLADLHQPGTDLP